MNLQVLVSTMHQKDHSLLDKMNIQSDAIVINQYDRNKFEEFEYRGGSIKFLSFEERGVGLSRNNALMRSTADICLFADDDVTYINDYKEIIIREFERNPHADVIVFNVPSVNPEREEFVIPQAKRLRFFNCLRYGTFRIAVKTTSIRKANICFSLLFGGGAKYSAGEDSLFMADCIKKGLHVYASPLTIGTVNHAESTWFSGYTEKYFHDKGALFACLTKRWARLYSLRSAIRQRAMYIQHKTTWEAIKSMFAGINEFRKRSS